MSGRIESIVGSMFSGKTTELQRRINRYKYQPINTPKIGIIKWSKDGINEEVVSHDGHKLKADFKPNKLMDIIDELKDYRVIGIDEGHFFPDDLVKFCEILADSGKIIIVAALDSDYLRRPLEHVTELMAKSESVVKLMAICQYCGKDAAFSLKTEENDELYKVGGDDLYKAVCRGCHKKHNKN